ncbi:hypothetical protein NR798_07515 [Archangium gephyra]|uniref:hypothetical protein n=1 Tax=Archangium gephyra TaxID=48 RepID=UPI0035D43ABA
MRLWKLSAAVLALFVVACGGETVTVDQQEAGSLQLPLVSTDSDGKVYRLMGATFNITGTQTVTVTDTAADTVTTPLLTGSYTIELAPGWTMERVDAPGTPVPATLLSPNPLPFFVKKGEITQVRFQFKLPGEGTADVGIEVDSGGWFAGSVRFEILDGSTPNPYAELVGKTVPFLISFKSFTSSRESWGSTLVHTGPVTVQFGGAPSAQLARVAAAFKDSELFLSLKVAGSGGSMVEFTNAQLWSPREGISFDVYPGSAPFVGVVDRDGFPVFRPFSAEAPARLYEPYAGYGVGGMSTVNASP